MGGHGGGSPLFVGWSPEKEKCAGRATGELRRLPGSHVSGAPVHLDAKCKAASRQKRGRVGGEGGLADTVLPAMPAESLKLRPI